MRPVVLTHLYAKEMAIYGDRGNLISLRDVLEYNSIPVMVHEVGIGDELARHSDFYFVGGGADKDQYNVIQDLHTKKNHLLQAVESGTPLLAICGGYQLLGHHFVGGDGTQIGGLGWFPVSTVAPDDSVRSRCVGNIVVQPTALDLGGHLVGFENHGGQTHAVDDTFEPLGRVITGFGNNSHDKLEGCVKNNTIGCYLHGPCLAKNPQLLTFFCSTILQRLSFKKDIAIPHTYCTLNEYLIRRFT